jgi:hypothetical protein
MGSGMGGWGPSDARRRGAQTRCTYNVATRRGGRPRGAAARLDASSATTLDLDRVILRHHVVTNDRRKRELSKLAMSG